MSDEPAGLKALQRAIWSAGDPDAVSELFWDAGAVVADAAAIGAGMRVLDVATDAVRAELRALVASYDAGAGEVRIAAEYLPVVGLKP